MHFHTEDDQRALLMLPPEQAQAAVEHAQTLDEAASVMLHRTSSYGLVWRRFGAISNLLNAGRKVGRLMEAWYEGTTVAPVLHKDGLDDAFDAINYLGFFIQNARHGNMTGDRNLFDQLDKDRNLLARRIRLCAGASTDPDVHTELHKIADILESGPL
jgi:hypothetical protein